MTSETLIKLQERINQTKTRYEELQQEINTKLQECSDCLATIEKLHHEVGKLTRNCEDQLANALNEEKEWEDIRSKLAIVSTDGLVTLNVGGVSYTTMVKTLTHEKNTFFTALFSAQWQIEKDEKDNSIFIDRNGQLFTYIIEYLRTGLMSKDIWKNESLYQSVLIEAEYFCIHSLISKLDLFPDGTLLETTHKNQLNTFYKKTNQRWELIYKASRDGFGANIFHSHCDNKGPTITIIQSNNNYLFGAYTSFVWTSAGGSYQNDKTAFLFTLTNPHNISPTKYMIKSGNEGNAVYHHSGYGPTFGGHDIHIANNSNTSNSSIGFSHSYVDTTGKGNSTFTGASSFLVSDIEVFKLA